MCYHPTLELPCFCYSVQARFLLQMMCAYVPIRPYSLCVPHMPSVGAKEAPRTRIQDRGQWKTPYPPYAIDLTIPVQPSCRTCTPTYLCLYGSPYQQRDACISCCVHPIN